MLDMIKIGEQLKALRKAHHLSQDDLAIILYVSHQAISKWEQGKSLPQLETLLTLSAYYKTSIETILCLENPLESDVDQLFASHSRMYVIKEVIAGNHKDLTYGDIIHKLSEKERFYALSVILKNTYPLELNHLWSRLSYEERRMIIFNAVEHHYPKNIQQLRMQMTLPEKNILKEGK